MDFGSINVELVAKLLLLLLVGLGPKIALVPFLDKTKGMSPAEQRATGRLMVQTAVVTALVIFAIGALLMRLLHITSGAVAIAGGIILALLAVRMASGPGEGVVVHGGCQMAESDARPAPTVCALVVVASLATACQPTNHLPASNAPLRSRAVAADSATARDRVAQALQDLGFSVRSTNDQSLTVVAERVGAPDLAWAECPLARAVDPISDANRSSFQRPETLRTNVVARFTTLAGTTNISLDVLQVGQYQNPFVALRFDERCRSAGGLEARLLDAAAV